MSISLATSILKRSQFEKALSLEPYKEWVKGPNPFLISTLAGIALNQIASNLFDFFGKNPIQFGIVAREIKNCSETLWISEILGVLGFIGMFLTLVYKDQHAFEMERTVSTILQQYRPNDYISLWDLQLLKKYAPSAVWKHIPRCSI